MNDAVAVVPAAFVTEKVTRYVTAFAEAAAAAMVPAIVPPAVTERPGGRPTAAYLSVSPATAPSEPTGSDTRLARDD